MLPSKRTEPISDVADTIIGLTVGFLFCVLCMCALGWWLSDNPPVGLDWQDYEAAYEQLP